MLAVLAQKTSARAPHPQQWWGLLPLSTEAPDRGAGRARDGLAVEG